MRISAAAEDRCVRHEALHASFLDYAPDCHARYAHVYVTDILTVWVVPMLYAGELPTQAG